VGAFRNASIRGENCVDPDSTGPLESGDGQFYSPNKIAVDDEGNVCVADSGNHRIQKFDNDGNFLAVRLHSRG
jgi:DNA-binding beta-propeller fold protein YncE